MENEKLPIMLRLSWDNPVKACMVQMYHEVWHDVCFCHPDDLLHGDVGGAKVRVHIINKVFELTTDKDGFRGPFPYNGNMTLKLPTLEDLGIKTFTNLGV